MDLVNVPGLILLAGFLIVFLSGGLKYELIIKIVFGVLGGIVILVGVYGCSEEYKLKITQEIICEKSQLNLMNVTCEKDGWKLVREKGKPYEIIYPKPKENNNSL